MYYIFYHLNFETLVMRILHVAAVTLADSWKNATGCQLGSRYDAVINVC